MIKKKKSGLASIIVVLMTVIIMTIGLSLVALSSSDEILAKKKNTWTARYYTLEGILMEDIANIDKFFIEYSELENIDGESLVKKIANAGYKLNSDIELSYDDSEVIINLFLKESEKKNPMTIDAVIQKNDDKHFVIKKFSQRQDNYEYNSFY